MLLSGSGVGAPALEYKPLWSRFSRHGRVAAAEYFGYGWSETTSVPRTSENIAEEIRAALENAGIHPPYVLVSHSLGSIYAMAYVQSYPEEIEAMIALDTMLPNGLIQARKHGESLPAIAGYIGECPMPLCGRPCSFRRTQSASTPSWPANENRICTFS